MYCVRLYKTLQGDVSIISLDVNNHMMRILKNVLMWFNISSRYGHTAFRTLERLDPPVLGPGGARTSGSNLDLEGIIARPLERSTTSCAIDDLFRDLLRGRTRSCATSNSTSRVTSFATSCVTSCATSYPNSWVLVSLTPIPGSW